MQVQKSAGEKPPLNTPLDQTLHSNNPHANIISANFLPNAQTKGMFPYLNSVSSSRDKWILDSGATHHIVCHMSLLSNPKEVHSMHVNLPNGQQAQISHTGSVYFSDDFILQNALCFLDFHYNLISVGGFIKDSNCIMKLHTDKCIIQDPIHGKMIGLAELQDGLYHLVFPAIIPFVCNMIHSLNKSTLWHARLGHTSYSKVQCLHLIDSKIQMNKELVCDCCHFAKQKRLPFHSSDSISDACFKWIHMDIWDLISWLLLMAVTIS